MKNLHERMVWTGTEAERLSVNATTIAIGTIWMSTDYLYVWWWDGTAWQPFMGFNDRWRQTGTEFEIDSYIEDFYGTARPAGWALAGAPFVNPASETYANSLGILIANGTANSRTFLYKNFTPNLIDSSVEFQIVTNVQNTCAGIRYDDGTDNNYYEALLRYNSGQVWNHRTNVRVGGGAVTTVDGAVNVPTGHTRMFLQAVGTKWTNWGGQIWTAQPYEFLRSNSSIAATAGYTWTPTRIGIIFNKGNSSSTWFNVTFDFFRSG